MHFFPLCACTYVPVCAALVSVLKFFAGSETMLLQNYNIFIVADEVCIHNQTCSIINNFFLKIDFKDFEPVHNIWRYLPA